MLSEKVIRYAVKEFETAIRQMSATRSSVHSFRLSDEPPATVMLVIAPTSLADKAMDDIERAMHAALHKRTGPAM